MKTTEQRIKQINNMSCVFVIIEIIAIIATLIGVLGKFMSLLIFGGSMIVVCLVAIILINKPLNKLKMQNEMELEQKATEKKNQFWANGEWIFPCKKFYELCEEKGVTNLESSYARQKANQIAKNILSKHTIPAEYHSIYVSDALIEEYFAKGKKIIEDKKLKEQKKQEEYNTVPHRGTPNDNQKQSIAMAKKLVKEHGTDKRRAMLIDSRNTLNKEIKKKEEVVKAMRELGVILSTSAYQEKPKDWALLGGIASGVAGAGAGMAVALDTMAENERIEVRNAQNRAAVTKISADIYSSSFDVEVSIEDMKEAEKILDKEIKLLDEKLVLKDVSAGELKKALKVTSKSIVKTDTNILEITLTVRNSYTPDVPDSVRITTDGMLIADVYLEGVTVGKAFLPLPLYGIECKTSEKIVGYCEHYMNKGGEYSIRINDYKLWAMEL